jgi:DNA-binding transcriptional LysR family regulator
LAQLADYQWVSYVDSLLFTDQLSYLKQLSIKLSADISPSFQSSSIVSQLSAIKSGLGIGILPCFLAEQDASLVKLCINDIKLVRSFYLVTHPESKRLSQVNTVWQYLKELAQQKTHILMPK